MQERAKGAQHIYQSQKRKEKPKQPQKQKTPPNRFKMRLFLLKYPKNSKRGKMIVKPNKELVKNKLLKQINNSIYDLYHALNDFNLSHNDILDDDFDYFQRKLFGDFGEGAQYKGDDLGEIQELYKIVIELIEKISKGDKC